MLSAGQNKKEFSIPSFKQWTQEHICMSTMQQMPPKGYSLLGAEGRGKRYGSLTKSAVCPISIAALLQTDTSTSSPAESPRSPN